LDVVFEVVGRARTEKLNKGKHEIVYRVSLKSVDGLHRLTLTDKNPEFLQQYPFGSTIGVKVGKNPQTSLQEKGA
jgi:hypothetical protein